LRAAEHRPPLAYFPVTDMSHMPMRCGLELGIGSAKPQQASVPPRRDLRTHSGLSEAGTKIGTQFWRHVDTEISCDIRKRFIFAREIFLVAQEKLWMAGKPG
jgi:hypothetical protein